MNQYYDYRILHIPVQKKNRCNIFFPCSLSGSRSSCGTFLILRCDKNKYDEKQNKEINIIYDVCQNIFKDILKYIEGKRCKNGFKFKDIKILINDYENNKVETEDEDDNEETEEENKEKIISKFDIPITEYLRLLNTKLYDFNHLKEIVNEYKFETFDDLYKEIKRLNEQINKIKKNPKDNN